MGNQSIAIEMEDVFDASELAKAQRQREQFDQNSAWLQSHISEIYAKHRDRYICIAGKELFVGDTVQDVITQARTAHPDDEGWFTRYIPKEKMPRVYAV